MQLSLDIDEHPAGLVYVPDFISADEERALLAAMAGVDWQAVVMHGQSAKRTVAHFGLTYGYDSWSLDAAAPLPSWAAPLLPRVASAMHEPPNAIAQLLASRYPEGARIGWHRDAPMFGPTVAGLSLAGACELELRAGDGGRHRLTLAPRSLYVLGGAARAVWQHMIRPVPSLRYSLTFRTLARAGARASGRTRGRRT
ncbi:MAG: alpha-ketoglutarate-dependent dioxygenase AlkB [Myxococcales bacterium]|nr:alpha-ketoglutarate-dependent dioxygenase AlkB [Myxococcales bacterium]